MIIRLLSITSLVLAVAAAPVLAAKPNKGAKGQGAAKNARLLARFDQDHNGVIDGEEATRVNALYSALYSLDTDHDGHLSDTELAAAKIPEGRKAGKKGTTTTPTTPAPSTSTPSTSTPAPSSSTAAPAKTN